MLPLPNKQSPLAAEAAVMKLKLGLTFSIVGEPDTAQRKKFEQGLQRDLAAAVGLPGACFQFLSMSAGSIIVDTRILPDPHAIGPAPHDAVLSVAQQAGDAQSPLRNGMYTRYIEAVGIQTHDNQQVSRMYESVNK